MRKTEGNIFFEPSNWFVSDREKPFREAVPKKHTPSLGTEPTYRVWGAL